MSNIKLFENKKVRSKWDEKKQKWFFSIIDVIAILTDNLRPRKYWNDLKKKLKDEGSQLSEKIGQLKMKAEDGKMRVTDVADTEQLLRLIQSIPSKKAEPFKRWLAKVGYERLQEIENPEIASKRMREIYKQKGCFHSLNYRMKTIVYDLMEEYRAANDLIKGIKTIL